jgi:hypothetical protein
MTDLTDAMTSAGTAIAEPSVATAADREAGLPEIAASRGGARPA